MVKANKIYSKVKQTDKYAICKQAKAQANMKYLNILNKQIQNSLKATTN